jgi:1-deoxy-D-xylulose-5-phosphate synthase
MRTYDEGPSAVRYPRDTVPERDDDVETAPFVLGKAHLLAPGTDLAILAYGFPANHALAAREALAESGYSVAVYDARFAKPLDIELLRQLIGSGTPVLTVEDHHVVGGFGGSVIEACHDDGLRTDGIHRLGLPDQWIYQGSRAEQQAEAGIDADAIARKAAQIIEASPRVAAARSKRAAS